MAKILVFNLLGELVTTLANDSSNKCPFKDDAVTEKLDGTLLFEFTVPYNHVDARSHLIAGNEIAIKDRDGLWNIFKITKIEDNKDSGEATRKVFCEGLYYELIDEVITAASYYGTDLRQAFTAALTGSRWTVGYVEPNIPLPELFDINDPKSLTNAFTMTPCLKAVNDLREKFEVELKYTIDLDANGNKIAARKLNVYKQRGQDRGSRFTYEKNMDSIKRTADFTEIKTRMYGKGAHIGTLENGTETYHDFSDALWISTVNPVNKPLGQIYVEIPEAVAKYGVREGVYEDSTTRDIYKLLTGTYKALKEACEPKITYSLNIIDLEKLLGYDNCMIRLGDVIVVQDLDFDLSIKVRITELKWSIEDASKVKMTLGNHIKSLSGVYARELGKVQNFTQYTYQTVTQVDNVVSDIVTTTPDGTVIVNPDAIDPGSITGDHLADETITDNKIVGLTASKITAGTINAADINVLNLNAANITVGKINGQQIGTGAIGEDHLGSGVIQPVHISQGAITTEHIGQGVITADNIANGSITSDKIPLGEIAADKLKLATHLLF